jgi:hypothetical protein
LEVNKRGNESSLIDVDLTPLSHNEVKEFPSSDDTMDISAGTIFLTSMLILELPHELSSIFPELQHNCPLNTLTSAPNHQYHRRPNSPIHPLTGTNEISPGIAMIDTIVFNQ